MIHYYIPDFFWKFNTNLRLLELMQTEPQMFYDDFKIGAVFGNFPNCIWNGGGISQGRYVEPKEMKLISDSFNSYNVPLRLTMTNLMLEERDCWDRYANCIMENLDNGFNQVLISNPILEEYVRKTYPNYPIVRSILAAENVFYDDSDKYFMSVLRKHKNDDIEFLQSIKHKEKIEILTNETCVENCPRAYTHYLEYAKKTLHIAKADEKLELSCPYDRKYPRQKFYSSPLCITREKIKEIYEPMGFQHFKISGRGVDPEVIIDYAHFMVKPEWKEEFICMMLPAALQDNR